MAAAADPRFASFDAVLAGSGSSKVEPQDPKPQSQRSASGTRRSISIFSRRGTDTPIAPSPTHMSFPDALMDRADRARQISAKQRRRQPSVSSASLSSTSSSTSLNKGPRNGVAALAAYRGGTILKAVPIKAARLTGLTTLDEELPCSPNDEILQTIESPSDVQVATSNPVPVIIPRNSNRRSSLSRSHSFSQNEATSPLAPSPSVHSRLARRKSTNDRIGMWVNGVAHWDQEPNSKAKRVLGIALSSPNSPNASRHGRHWSLDDAAIDTGNSSFHPDSTGFRERPNLSVYIPGGEVSGATQLPDLKSTLGNASSTVLSKFSAHPPSSQHPAYRPFRPSITVHEVNESSPTDSVASPPQPADRATKKPGSPTRLDALTSALKVERPGLHSGSNSSDSTDATNDEHSVYSKPSSATSTDLTQGHSHIDFATMRKGGGGSDSRPSSNRSSRDKPLPPVPGLQPNRPAPSPPLNSKNHPSISSLRNAHRHSSLRSLPAAGYGKPTGTKLSRAMTTLDQYDADFMRSSPKAIEFQEEEKKTPTLSQVEDELNEALAELSTSDSIHSDDAEEPQTAKVQTISVVRRQADVKRQGSVRSVMQPPEVQPSLPTRSRKRDWRISTDTKHSVETADTATIFRSNSESMARRRSFDAAAMREIQRPAQLRRSSTTARRSVPQDRESVKFRMDITPALAEDEPERPRPKSEPNPMSIDDGLVVVDGPVKVVDPVLDEYQQQIEAAAQAEEVLLLILKSLADPVDLFNTAIINKGMYRVFKENEMSLVRNVHFNQSPPAWEFREWCPLGREEPEGPESQPRNGSASSEASIWAEHTPISYLRCQTRDSATIDRLKVRILEHCSSFIRKDTATALADPTDKNAQRITDAFWRIWCFCKIFGSNKDREDDVTGQLDWLKGGNLANVQDCGATVSGNLDLDMSSVLLNAPDHFAKGNDENGLSEEQLYDMTEVWTCLTTLLSAYIGRIKQARDVGIFDDFDITEGDIENEETILEEWIYYILTLGLDVVLDMAVHAVDEGPAGFDHAFEMGWTTWSSPEHGGSRITFLKEPVSRLYEERVAISKSANPRELEKKERNRQRVASLAAEIRLARQTSNYRRLPLIDQENERPMSMFSRNSSTRSSMTVTSHVGDLTQSNSRRIPPAPAIGTAAHARNQSATSAYNVPATNPPPRAMRPIREGQVETFNRQSLQNFGTGEAENTSERAIRRITDLGFTVDQAKQALRATDMGDGLRVDRAVDLLFRQRDS